MISGEATCPAEVIQVLLLRTALVSGAEDVMAEHRCLWYLVRQVSSKSGLIPGFFFFIMIFFSLLGVGEHNNSFGAFLN